MSVIGRWKSKYFDVSPRVKEVVDVDGVVIQTLLADGSEQLDDTPIAPPVGYVKSVPLHLQIREMVRSEALRLAAEESGMETFEESEDFDVGDDYEPSTPYESDFDPDIHELSAALEEERLSSANKRSVAPGEGASSIHPAKPGGSAEPDGDSPSS